MILEMILDNILGNEEAIERALVPFVGLNDDRISIDIRDYLKYAEVTPLSIKANHKDYSDKDTYLLMNFIVWSFVNGNIKLSAIELDKFVKDSIIRVLVHDIRPFFYSNMNLDNKICPYTHLDGIISSRPCERVNECNPCTVKINDISSAEVMGTRLLMDTSAEFLRTGLKSKDPEAIRTFKAILETDLYIKEYGQQLANSALAYLIVAKLRNTLEHFHDSRDAYNKIVYTHNTQVIAPESFICPSCRNEINDDTARVSIWEGNKASLCNACFNKIFRQKLQEYADKQIDANTIVNLDEDIVLK